MSQIAEPVLMTRQVTCPTCQMGWWLNPPAKCDGSNHFRCIGCKAIYSGEMLAASDMLAALKTCQCPGGGWNGMPTDTNPTVENCMAAGKCGCDCGTAINKAEGR